MGATRKTTGPFAVKDHSRLVADTQSDDERAASSGPSARVT